MTVSVRTWLRVVVGCCFFLAGRQAAAQTVLQAETAVYGGALLYNSPFQGYHDSGFLGSLEQPGASYVQFAVPTATAGMYTLTMRYALGLPYLRTLSVYVNGRDVTQVQFAPTGAWDGWATQAVTVYLPQTSGTATNQVMYRYDSDDNGRVNLDELTIAAATTPGYATGSAAAAVWPAGLGVDQFSGTAQFSIPLFTITDPGISVPVGLAYAATGVRVDDNGGMVGVNWSLQADISIRRVVRGLPDDSKAPTGTADVRYGWLYQSASPSPYPTVNLSSLVDGPAACSDQQTARALLDQLGTRARPASGPYSLYDPEPDIFYYNLPGHSGRFVFDQQGHAHTFPYDPIDISWGTVANLQSSGGIGIFTIKTPEGTKYTLNIGDWVWANSSTVTSTPNYFGGDYLGYLLPLPQNSLGDIFYQTAWHASLITSPEGGYVTFDYQSSTFGYYNAPSSIEEHRFLPGSSTDAPALEYRKTLRYQKSNWLKGISSSTSRASFELMPVAYAPDDADQAFYYVRAINLFAPYSLFPSPGAGDALLKRYTLQYTQAKPDFPNLLPWFDEKGTALEGSEPRRFLRQVSLSTGYTTAPLYTFTYSQLDVPTPPYGDDLLVPCPLPPLNAVNKDYWGFYNANNAKTLIPQLYLYPQLLGSGAPAGAPYRLFELAPGLATAAGGLTLPGADRRPAADFTAALAGTLTEIAFSTGGKAVLEYEPHRFYDPVAHQTLPAGGVRVRTVKVQDPVTRTESRRDYGYEADNGTSSGVLLHAPRLAFAVPTGGTAGPQQWLSATVRSGEDLGTDPFESRIVGYQRVAERVPGRGQTVTEFTAPAPADAVTASSIWTDYDGTATTWQRPAVGVASVADAGNNCPSVAPLPVGADLYPFAVAPAFDYQRGLPLRVTSRAEPTGPAAGDDLLVQRRDFSYVHQAVAPYTVTGVVYERVGLAADAPYFYAKSKVVTGYQLVPREQKTTFYTPAGAVASELKTVSHYNAHGWPATVASQNSDGSYQRTRYRYLADYQLPAAPSTPTVEAMRARAAQGIGADVVETISEVVPVGGPAHFKAAALQTYHTEPARNPGDPATAWTRPHQLWRHLAASSLTGRTDTLSLPGDTEYPGRLVATTQEVDQYSSAPVSTHVEAGRQTRAQLLGYYGTLPILQLTGASVSEVVFSDFETSTDHGFLYASPSSAPPVKMLATDDPGVARTGRGGWAMAAGSLLTHPLPPSAAARYRLVWWARAAQATTFTVQVAQGSQLLPAQTVPLPGGDWQRLEVVLPDLSAIGLAQRPGYSLRVLPGSAVQVDDVLLLPAEATATTTTYELTLGKTSETDDRGRTSYYEYSPGGKLTRIRDHNQAIVRQVEQVVAGRRSDETIMPTFVVIGDAYDGADLTFAAYGPHRGDLLYQWDFGDATAPTAFSATNSTIHHTFHTSGQTTGYQVRLSIQPAGSGASAVYTGQQTVGVLRVPVRLNITLTDVTEVDDCHVRPVTSTSSQISQTTYTATPSVAGGSYTYQWESYQEIAGYPSWTTLSETSPTFVQHNTQPIVFRCRITDTVTHEVIVSASATVNHYKSTPVCP